MLRSALLIVFLPSFSYSQAPFELENRKALKLTESRLQTLLNKEWRVEKVETDNRGDLTENTWTSRKLNYKSDGSFIYGWHTGNWTILEGKYIKHQLERKDEVKMNFGGTYAVTSMGDSSLVLTKILTSSRDMKRVIYLTLKTQKKVTSQFVSPNLYNKKLTISQIDSISRLSKEHLFESNFRFWRDTIYFPTKDSLYKIKIKPRD